MLSKEVNPDCYLKCFFLGENNAEWKTQWVVTCAFLADLTSSLCLTVSSVVLVKTISLCHSTWFLGCSGNLLMLLWNSCMCSEMLQDFFKFHILWRLWSSYWQQQFCVKARGRDHDWWCLRKSWFPEIHSLVCYTDTFRCAAKESYFLSPVIIHKYLN